MKIRARIISGNWGWSEPRIRRTMVCNAARTAGLPRSPEDGEEAIARGSGLVFQKPPVHSRQATPAPSPATHGRGLFKIEQTGDTTRAICCCSLQKSTAPIPAPVPLVPRGSGPVLHRTPPSPRSPRIGRWPRLLGPARGLCGVTRGVPSRVRIPQSSSGSWCATNPPEQPAQLRCIAEIVGLAKGWPVERAGPVLGRLRHRAPRRRALLRTVRADLMTGANRRRVSLGC
jgi:hypothetical protein